MRRPRYAPPHRMMEADRRRADRTHVDPATGQSYAFRASMAAAAQLVDSGRMEAACRKSHWWTDLGHTAFAREYPRHSTQLRNYRAAARAAAMTPPQTAGEYAWALLGLLVFVAIAVAVVAMN